MTTPETSKLAASFAKAQGTFPVIPKDSEVKVSNKEGKFLYKYKYADLTTIISSTRPSLSENGLSFTQGMVEGGFCTTIMHESGEKLVTGFVPFNVPQGSDMKTVAGLFTYVKRISLTAALGVSADEDVDAAHIEATSGNNTNKEKGIDPDKGKPKTVKDNTFILPTPERLKAIEYIKQQLARQPNWATNYKEISKKITGVSSSKELEDLPEESITEITKLLLTTYKIEE